MKPALLARGVGVATCFFFLGAGAVPFSDGQTLQVTSTADAKNLTDALNCTGGGAFDVIWYGSVAIKEIIQVTDGISLTVTGSGASRLSPDDDTPTATVIGLNTTAGSGMFNVSGASTLTLNNLVLQGGYSNSTDDDGAGVIKARGSDFGNQTINVFDCQFVDNYGTYAGAIIVEDSVVIKMHGTTSFNSNTGGWARAIRIASDSWLNLYGASTFFNNTGTNNGDCDATIDGNNTFSSSTAGNNGGAISASHANVTIEGAVFSNNSAESGGALRLYHSDATIGGNTTFTSNTASSTGGAISAKSANVTIEGVIFTKNTAGQDGGAMFAEETNLHIAGATMFTNNTASGSGGGLDSTDCQNISITGGVIFAGNVASINGGAITMDSAGYFFVDGANFARNEAGSGGAIWAVTTTADSQNIFRCTFEENSATDGGALYLFNSDGKTVHVKGSGFRDNIAVASGGAIYHTATLKVSDTRFVANKAYIKGMAVCALGTFSVGSKNVSFQGNALYCPSSQYGYDEDISMVEDLDTCRAEVVCTGCSTSCDKVLYGLSFASDSTVPAAVCNNIPVGTVASSAGTTVSTLELDEGYYRTSNESHVVLECYQKDSCVGGLDASSYCALGYEGPYCAVCAEGYRPGFAYSCHKCSGKSLISAVALVVTTTMILLGVVVVVLSDLVAVVGMDGSNEETQERARGLRKWASSSWHNFLAKILPLTSIKIVVVVWQILTQFAAIAGEVYPDEYQLFLSNLSPINMDIGFILSFSCLADTNFYDRLLLSTTMPLVVLAVLVGTYSIAREKNRGSESAIRTVQHKHLSAALFVMFFVYSSVSFTVFQTFVCDTLDDGVGYLRADYSLTCWSDEYIRYAAYASVMVFVYPIGIPAAFTWWLVRNRHDLSRPGREAVAELQPFSGIWAAYRPSHFYYEVVECGRRIALTGIAAFLFPGSAAQIAIVLLLAVVFSFVSESVQPFKDKLEMRLYRWGNGVVLGSMYVALLRKADVSGDSSPAQSAFAGVLIAGNVFMVVAVLVQSALFANAWHASDEIIEMNDPFASHIHKSSVSCIQPVGDEEEAEMEALDVQMENT